MHHESAGRQPVKSTPPPWAAAALAGVLVLTGCSPTPSPGPEPTATSSPTPTPTAPTRVFTDNELRNIGAAMLWQRGQSIDLMFDSNVTRTSFDTKPVPVIRFTTQPPECGAFHPPTNTEALKDLSLNFATGTVPLAGESGPTTTILLTLRSADRDKLVKADFDYTDDLASRCGQFEVIHEGQDSAPHKTVMLNAPTVGEKAYALMSPSDPATGQGGLVGFRALSGTLSVSMILGVTRLTTEEEARPALLTMSGIARDLIEQATHNAPTLPPPPMNARNPQQLTDLLQEVTGPDGKKVDMAAGTVIYGASRGPMVPCMHSDGTYWSALVGSAHVWGEFPPSMIVQGTTAVIAGFTIQLISVPYGTPQPYPFDRRAEDLRNCPTIQEQVFKGTASTTNQWTEVHRLNPNVSAESTYAIAHLEQPGPGTWHVLAGARKGALSVEMATMSPEPTLQASVDAMAAVMDQVFAKAAQ